MRRRQGRGYVKTWGYLIAELRNHCRDSLSPLRIARVDKFGGRKADGTAQLGERIAIAGRSRQARWKRQRAMLGGLIACSKRCSDALDLSI